MSKQHEIYKALENSTAPKMGAQAELEMDEVVCHLHFWGRQCDWLVQEFDPEEDLAYGCVFSPETPNGEHGYFSVAELTRGGSVLNNEEFTPQRFKEALTYIKKFNGEMFCNALMQL
jgi:hypothetical protein